MNGAVPIPTVPGDWVGLAVCASVDPELFFPEPGDNAINAIRVCRGCDVWAQCLKYAMENDIQDGVWGGISARDRLKMKWNKARRTA